MLYIFLLYSFFFPLTASFQTQVYYLYQSSRKEMVQTHFIFNRISITIDFLLKIFHFCFLRYSHNGTCPI